MAVLLHTAFTLLQCKQNQHKKVQRYVVIYFQIKVMSEEIYSIERVLDSLILLHALLNLPITNLMKVTYYCNCRDLAFPTAECRRDYTIKFQNYKRAISRNAIAIEQRVESLLDIDLISSYLFHFERNFYLDKFYRQFQSFMMSRSAKKSSPTRHQAGGAPKPSYNNYDDRDDLEDDEASYAEQSFHNDHMQLSPIARSPIKPTALVGYQHHAEKPFQLVESADGDANFMGLIVTFGNSKRLTDSGRKYSNWMRVTKPIYSLKDYAKTDLMLVQGHRSLLQITYPAVSTASTKDFKQIEAQMEVDIEFVNEFNKRYASNLQERIIVQEALLAKSENVMRNRFISLPIDPTTGKQYTCHNNDWQGNAHDDTNIGETYLRKYQISIPIMPEEIIEGGGVDAGLSAVSGKCGMRHYIGWLIPVSGQDSDKLTEKRIMKTAIKLKTKEEKALEMLSRMNILG